MPQRLFEPCIPTRVAKVPSGPDWIYEIKHDGYRLIVQREGKRVRLFTRNGHDWTERYPLIVEAALRNRATSFVIDGEAVLLGVDGVSDFDGLHSRKYDSEVASTPSIVSRSTATICASCRCRCERPISPGCWRAAPIAPAHRRTG
jgi:ATP-dependent DNA ligase